MFEDNFKDYFESAPQPEEQPAKKVESLEEGQEREIEESTIERKHSRKRLILVCAVLVAVLAAAGWFWATYLHPYKIAQNTGRLVEMSCQGVIFKTYEGKMISEKFIADTLHYYQSDFLFTVKNDSVASQVKALCGSGKKVTLNYEEYKGRLPWRGETKCFVTSVEVDK